MASTDLNRSAERQNQPPSNNRIRTHQQVKCGQKNGKRTDQQVKYASKNRKRTHKQVKNSVYPHKLIQRAHISNISLDQLPREILDLIVESLQQRELLSVCLVSKALQQAAYKRLYRKVTIIDENWLYHGTPLPNSNKYTLVPNENRDLFLAAVKQNPKISSLIQYLSISNVLDSSVTYGLRDYLIELLPHVQLQFFHCLDENDIPPILLQNMPRMSVYLVDVHPFPENLVELKITTRGYEMELENFEDLASELINYNSYGKLKKLAFHVLDYMEYLEYVPRQNVLGEACSLWSKFFNAFSAQDITLQLTALGLDGDFWDSVGDYAAEEVLEAIDITKLETLDIVYSHYVRDHGYETHKDGVHKFLDEMTQNVPSLQRLTITHRQRISPNEVDALGRVLRENIPNQLHHLRVTFHGQSDLESKLIQSTILEHQQNLVKLKFVYDPFLGANRREYFGIPALGEMQQTLVNEKDTTEALSPTIFDYDECRPFLKKEHLNTVITHKNKILDYLESDEIYTRAAQNLPFLKEYIVLGLYINMKTRCILFNGQYIGLDRNQEVVDIGSDSDSEASTT